MTTRPPHHGICMAWMMLQKRPRNGSGATPLATSASAAFYPLCMGSLYLNGVYGEA